MHSHGSDQRRIAQRMQSALERRHSDALCVADFSRLPSQSTTSGLRVDQEAVDRVLCDVAVRLHDRLPSPSTRRCDHSWSEFALHLPADQIKHPICAGTL